MSKSFQARKSALMAGAAAIGLTAALATAPAGAVVPNDNFTPTDIIDNAGGVNGVGMFFTQFGGVCTGSLINPRTVLFAAHCVNSAPATAYGDYAGAIRSAWGFDVDAFPGIVDWFFGGFASNPSLNVFDVNQILYHPDSLARPVAQGFLEADVAISSLSAPAGDIPTWALLFSPLPSPASIDPVNGTGYHVNITGYGRTGSGSVGDVQGIDFRRRAAENMLGSLASLNDRSLFLFGAITSDLPQLLYSLDFDDPNDANIFDFNLFRDEALVREGTTAPGDSGGPLVLDAANNSLASEDLILGVLSGSARFFPASGQVFSSYGTQSFYQPLFLYWDWIAANNPYRYVTAAAGDGAWEDPNHWLTLADPAYRIIDSSGNVVAGIPTNPGLEVDGVEPTFGEICVDFHPRGGGTCQNLETGDLVATSGDAPLSAGGSETASPSGAASGDMIADDFGGGPGFAALPGGPEVAGTTQGVATALAPNAAEETGSAFTTQAFSLDPLPAATLANGLPGATGFVPDNIDPDILAGVSARYFDVTLAASGTTTLSSAAVVDRLTIAGAGAGLDITSGGALASLIDVNQLSGSVNIDGTLVTPGDYLLMSGVLSGSGFLTTPFLTNVAGAVAPGGVNEVGNFQLLGNYIQSSGAGYIFDISPTGRDGFFVNGDVSLGGGIVLNYIDGAIPRFGDNGVVLGFSGTAMGNFDQVIDLPGVLFATTTVNADNVFVSVDAASFTTVLPASFTPNQLSQALALDAARSTSFGAMSDLFSQVDILSGDALAFALDLIAPRDALASGLDLQFQSQANASRFASRFMTTRNGGGRGARFITDEAGVEVASADPMEAFHVVATPAGGASLGGPRLMPMAEGWGLFGEMAYALGEGDNGFGTENDIQSLALTVGVDRTFGTGGLLGVLASYNIGDNDFAANLGGSELSGFSLAAYGSYANPLATVDGYIGFGQLDLDTIRTAPLGPLSLQTQGNTDADQFIAGAALSRQFTHSNGVAFIPSLALDYADYEIDGYTETGAINALNIDGRSITTFQASAGGRLSTVEGLDGSPIYPSIGLRAVYDLNGERDIITGNYVLAPAATFVTLGPDRDKFWGEYDIGLTFVIDSRATGRLSYSGTFERDDLEYSRIGGELRIQF